MASIKTRISSDGSRSYRVVWKEGGGRDDSWESETLSIRSDAARFCRDVNNFGQHWPDRWIKGVGYDSDSSAAAEPVPSFLSFAQTYVRALTGITPATRHRYDRQVLALDAQLRVLVQHDVSLGNVEDVHIRRWVNAREAAGVRPKTIANYHGLLYAIFASTAGGRGLRLGNPCAGTRLPDRYSPDDDDDNDVVFLTEHQFRLLADAMFPEAQYTEVPTRRRGRMANRADGLCAGTAEDRLLVEVAVGTGLRWSEITALQVADLELDGPAPRLSVRRMEAQP